MKIDKNKIWGLIPARGGSKSVKLKHIAPFNGRPLIDYVIRSAQVWERFDRIICSTDSETIADRCLEMGIDVVNRPVELAGDGTPVFDVIRNLMDEVERLEGVVPEYVALLQPTSPFLLPEHIALAVDALRNNPTANSVQTVVPCQHNAHSINQRIMVDGRIDFRYPEERRECYNKQLKPKHYVAGNLFIFRVEAAMADGHIFAQPSLPMEIDYLYGFDVDSPDDFVLGEAIVQNKLVDLSFMKSKDKE